MEELINKYLSNGLADFAGLEITGSIPVKQEIINEFITSFLQDATRETGESAVAGKAKAEGSGTGKSTNPDLPVKALLGMVQRAEVEAVEGKLILHFAIKR